MKLFPTLLTALLLPLCAAAQPDDYEAYFHKLNDSVRWKTAMQDNGRTNPWQKNWFLDGKLASVENIRRGIFFSAGPTPASDADHSVLWTKRNFEGDIKIEYDFTRIDDLDRFVNILYIQAEGSGEPGYDKDISLWSDKREVPAMKMYFNHMNAIHISYAAYENDPVAVNPDYIRGRRYMPEWGQGLSGTDLTPEYLSPVKFLTGETYHITVLKVGKEVMMEVVGPQAETYYYYFSAEKFPPVTSGRVGLRQMSGRKAVYSDIRIYTSK